jgi:tetratricopeptide (TPR) repeat protein
MKKLLCIIVFFAINFSFYKAQQYTIKQIDGLISYAEDFSRKAPNNAIALNERNYKISQKANYPAGMVKSMSMLSSCYLNAGNFKKALEYAKKTEKEAADLNDYKSMCNGLRVSAMSYAILGFNSEAQKMITEAFSIADKIVNPDDFFEIKGNLYCAKMEMAAYSAKNTMTVSEYFEYAKKSIIEFSKIKNSETRNNSLGTAYSNLGIIYVQKKMFDSAYYYSNKSLNLAKINKNPYNECVALNGLVSASNKQKKYQQEIDYLEKLIPIAKKINEPNLLKSSYRSIQVAYDHIGNKEKEMEYFAKYTQLSDSLARVNNLEQDVSVQKIVNEKEKTFIDEKENLYLLIAAICSLSALASYFGYKAFRNYKQEKKEKQKKEDVIQEKESQLTELKQQINNAFEEVLELAKKDDSSFLTRFTEVYPDFIEKLNRTYPTLTSGQLKFCALLKLNFSTKEIAYYNNISARSVEIKKGRLRKQLDISSSEDLNKWMINV